jgi:hypothetical protein
MFKDNPIGKFKVIISFVLPLSILKNSFLSKFMRGIHIYIFGNANIKF